MVTASKRNRMMNRARILRAIWRRPGSSRVDIAGVLGLDKSTVSSIVTELLEGEIVREVAEGDSSPLGGRRPVHLQLNSDYGDILGVELQPGFFRAVRTDFTGTITRTWSSKRPRNGARFEEWILGILEELLAAIEPPKDRVVGIGVAMGGLVNSIGNVIYRSIPMEIEEEYDFQRGIAETIGVPVIAENDANACAWGELTAHRGKTVHDLLYVLVQIRGSMTGRRPRGGIGVGLGIAINGTLYPGARFTAGEFRSAFRNAEGIGQFTLTEEEEARVPTDRPIRSRFFRELAKNIALIVNVMNLDHIFVGGDVIGFENELKPILEEELIHNWPYETGVECEVYFSSYGRNAVVAGAVGMVLDRLFTNQIFPLGDIRDRHERHRVVTHLSEHGFHLESVGD